MTRTDKDCTVIESTEAFAARDRQIVDEVVNSYLADAGVKQRPGRFCWFVRLPSQFSTWEELRAASPELSSLQSPRPPIPLRSHLP